MKHCEYPKFLMSIFFHSTRVGWKVHKITLYLLSMTFFINRLQALQHWWKKRIDRKGKYLIWSHFMRVSWSAMNFSADRHTSCNIDRISVWTTRETMLKINFIWSHSMRVSWSAYKLFCQPSYKLYLVIFHESILISLWTFPPTLIRLGSIFFCGLVID